MSMPSSSSADATATTAPLLQPEGIVPGVVDDKGRPVSRSRTGGWRSASFIIGVEVAERFAYYGASLNLINYLTGPMGQSTAVAAENMNVWSGVSAMLPLFGAFVADSYLGRYWTIFFSSLLYILGIGMLALSASLSSLRPSNCINEPTSTCHPAPTPFQTAFFFASIYLLALGQGGHQPSMQAFGADQFDLLDPAESKAKSSFFNWYYFGICIGTASSLLIAIYIQDNLGWGLGFSIPCAVIAGGLLLFLLGTTTYRHTTMEGKSPYVKMAKTIVTQVQRKIQIRPSKAPNVDLSSLSRPPDKTNCNTFSGSEEDEENCSSLLQLVPIWATCLVYAIVFAQSSTFFTKQGSTMDRRIGSHFLLSPATVQIFISLSIIVLMPVYDRILVPMARSFTGIPSGITLLQRIGIGMVTSIMSMAVAAAVEARRLAVARDAGLVDQQGVTLPMSVWWLVPQNVLYGISDVFTMVGLQELFYTEMPEGLRSMGVALYVSIFGIGSFLSGLIISLIDKLTSANGESWFSTNLNKAHLDYFYLLLGGLSMLSLGLFLCFSKSYVYKTKCSA